MSSNEFDQESYWIRRHDQYRGDPRSVGTFAATREQNELGEKQLKEIVGVLAGLLPKRGNVLDLGCGYGRVASSFLEQGLSYEGIDISPVAVRRARQENPGGTFTLGNIDEWVPQQQYDVVALLFVLVHFVDDQRWQRLLEAAVSAVAPRGYLIVADEMGGDTERAAMHFKSRRLARFDPIIEAGGLRWDWDLRERLLSCFPGVRQATMFYFASKPD